MHLSIVIVQLGQRINRQSQILLRGVTPVSQSHENGVVLGGC